MRARKRLCRPWGDNGLARRSARRTRAFLIGFSAVLGLAPAVTVRFLSFLLHPVADSCSPLKMLCCGAPFFCLLTMLDGLGFVESAGFLVSWGCTQRVQSHFIARLAWLFDNNRGFDDSYRPVIAAPVVGIQKAPTSDKKDKRPRNSSGNGPTDGSQRKIARVSEKALVQQKVQNAGLLPRALTSKEIQILKISIRKWEETDELQQPSTDTVQLIPAAKPFGGDAAVWRSTFCACKSTRTMFSCRSCNEVLRHRFRMPEFPGKEFYVGCGSCKWRGPCNGGNCCKTPVQAASGDVTSILSLKGKENTMATTLLDALVAAGQEIEDSETAQSEIPPSLSLSRVSALGSQSRGTLPLFLSDLSCSLSFSFRFYLHPISAYLPSCFCFCLLDFRV